MQPTNRNFVTVHVSATAWVLASDGTHQVAWSGAQIELEAIKDGGQRASITGSTGADGSYGPLTTTFEVYREQPVEVEARVIGGILPEIMNEDPWDPQKYAYVQGYKRLDWATVSHREGAEYFWSPDVQINVKPR